jgi:hypothetical protein
VRNEAEDPGRCGTGGCAGCAGAADEFYVVQDVKTKKCTIVDKKPVDTQTIDGSPS